MPRRRSGTSNYYPEGASWSMSARRRRTVRLTRDLVSYVTGLAGIIYETIRNGTERPSLLLVFAAMIALPKVLARDEHAAAQIPPPDQIPGEAPKP